MLHTVKTLQRIWFGLQDCDTLGKPNEVLSGYPMVGRVSYFQFTAAGQPSLLTAMIGNAGESYKLPVMVALAAQHSWPAMSPTRSATGVQNMVATYAMVCCAARCQFMILNTYQI